MPFELIDAELATAATACRAMAYQEGERAKNMENPTTRGPIEAAAQRYARLAEKLELARKAIVQFLHVGEHAYGRMVLRAVHGVHVVRAERRYWMR